MTTTAGTMIFGSGNNNPKVFFGLDTAIHRHIETWPAGTAVELTCRFEQYISTTWTSEISVPLFVIESA